MERRKKVYLDINIHIKERKLNTPCKYSQARYLNTAHFARTYAVLIHRSDTLFFYAPPHTRRIRFYFLIVTSCSYALDIHRSAFSLLNIYVHTVHEIITKSVYIVHKDGHDFYVFFGELGRQRPEQ